jgi:LPXTG-motif cell wall-anchored protein
MKTSTGKTFVHKFNVLLLCFLLTISSFLPLNPVMDKANAQMIEPQFLKTFGSNGSGNGQFNNPYGVDVNSKGESFVSDSNNDRIQKFDQNGTFLMEIRNPNLSIPYGLVIDSEDYLYVASTGTNTILKFDSQGNLIGSPWVGAGTEDSKFENPYSLAVDANNNVYVADYFNNRIQKFTSNGQHLLTIGKYGTGDGEFYNPMGVAVDSKGNIYVSDTNTHRIQKFNSNGTFIKKWDSKGTDDVEEPFNCSLTIDSADNLYVGDYLNHRVQVFTSEGEFITKWGSFGTGNGQLAGPIQVGFHDTNIYVAEFENHRISVFSVRELIEPAKNLEVGIGSITGKQGATVEVPVNAHVISNATTVENVTLVLEYDKSKLELVDTTSEEDTFYVFPDMDMVSWFGEKSSPGPLFNLKFKVKTDAGLGDSLITVNEMYSSAIDGAGRSINLRTMPGKMTIENGLSSNADLSLLTLDAAALEPGFSAGVTNYTANVGNAVQSIQVTPTLADQTATVTVNGQAVSSGAAKQIYLVGGSTPIDVIVTAQDGTTKAYTIALKRNQLPVAENSTFSVNENAPNDTKVGKVIASDADGDSLNYSIVSGNTDNIFKINATTGEIKVANGSLLDYESIQLYTLAIQVSDGRETHTATVTININDQNDNAPVPQGFTKAINENLANGTTIGTVTANDADTNSEFTYAITAGNGTGAFAINPNTGEIRVANSSKLDYETVQSFMLTVQVSDGVNTADTTVTINLINLNDNTPVMNDAVFHVDENALTGTWVGTARGTDADGDSISYSIVSGNDEGAFAINAVTGDIIVLDNSKLDHETKSSYAIAVMASEITNVFASPYAMLTAITRPATNVAVMTINVRDLNDNSPVPQGFTTAIDENTAAGTFVGKVTATDADFDSERTYTITAGNEAGAFAIDQTSGDITAANAAKLDYETVQSFSLTVQVSDGENTADTTVVIDLNNLNDNTPVANDAVFSVEENAANGTAVGTVMASDSDGDSLQFGFLTGNETGTFTIHPSTGKITVADASKIDYESVQNYTLKVEVTDGVHATNATVTINLTNLNDNPPTVSDAEFAIDENSANGTFVGAVHGTDTDGDVLKYSIVSENSNGAFEINADTGNITVTDGSQLDYEEIQNLTLSVQVSDGKHKSTSTVTVNLTNLNDNSPVVKDAAFTIDEKTTNEASVGAVEASDADGAVETYTLVSGNEDGIFAIHETTGEITVDKASLLNAAKKADYTLTVGVHDGQHTTNATVTVHVMSSETALSQLTSSKGDLNPEFKPGKTQYTVNVGESVKSIKVTPTTENANAKVKVNGKQLESGHESDAIDLEIGKNKISVEVTAENGLTTTYSIMVTRLQAVVPAIPVKDGGMATVSDEKVNLLDQKGTLTVELKQNLDEVETLKFTAEQLETLLKRNVTIKVVKNDVELLVPAVNFTNGEDLVISLEKLEKNPKQLPSSNLATSAVYEFTIKQGDRIISHFDHEIELAFPTEGYDHPEELKVYYWNEGKKEWELVGGTYENGRIKAMTNHFSTFAVFHPNDLVVENVVRPSDLVVEKTESDLPDTATNMYNWLMAGLLLVTLGGFLFFIQRRRQRNDYR